MLGVQIMYFSGLQTIILAEHHQQEIGGHWFLSIRKLLKTKQTLFKGNAS